MYVPIKRKTHLKENKRKSDWSPGFITHACQTLEYMLYIFKIILIKETLNQTPVHVYGEFVLFFYLNTDILLHSENISPPKQQTDIWNQKTFIITFRHEALFPVETTGIKNQ